jgi:transcriptional regulator with XRE-family HTH domain
MSKLGAVLKSYQSPGQIDADFAKKCGIDAPTLSRILNGEIPVAPPRQWKRIVNSFRGEPERQFAVIAAQLTDYLGEEIVKLIEIRRRVGAHSELVDLPLDEFERALRNIRERGAVSPAIKRLTINFAEVALGYSETK